MFKRLLGRTSGPGASTGTGDASSDVWRRDSGVARCVVLSDTHSTLDATVGCYARVPDGDVLIHCGDITRYGTLQELEAFNTWLAGLPHPVKIVIPGNHDLCCDPNHAQQAAARAVLTNATHYLVDDLVAVDLVGPAGRGKQALRPLVIYANPTTIPIGFEKYSAFALTEEEQASRDVWRKLRESASPIDVIVTHSPPHGILDRMWRVGPHQGSRALNAALSDLARRNRSPTYHCFGHVHNQRGVQRGGDVCDGVPTSTVYVNAAWEPDAAKAARKGCGDAVVIDVNLQ